MIVTYTYVGTTTAHFTNGKTYIVLSEASPNLPNGASFIDDTGAITFATVTPGGNWTLTSIVYIGPVQLYP